MILAILQARVSSTRLPGKALMKILGRPMLSYEIERIRRCRRIDELLVATTHHAEDDAIASLCSALGVNCFRGAREDVLDRFYQAAKPVKPDHVVRLTGDCPLLDPDIIDQTIDYYLQGGFDYTSNALDPTFPDGLDTEIFRYRILEEAWEEATLLSQREHVTPFFYQHKNRYRVGVYKNSRDLSKLRWTVDEAIDFEVIRKIYESLYPINPEFRTSDILKLLARQPDLGRLNQHIERNWGYKTSLSQDKHV